MAFKQELIELSSCWKELGLPVSCPYPLPTPDELAVHRKEFEDFVVARDLKQKLTCVLETTPDGWVPTEFWEATKSAHKEALDVFIQTVRDGKIADDREMSEEDLMRMWPFDIE